DQAVYYRHLVVLDISGVEDERGETAIGQRRSHGFRLEIPVAGPGVDTLGVVEAGVEVVGLVRRGHELVVGAGGRHQGGVDPGQVGRRQLHLGLGGGVVVAVLRLVCIGIAEHEAGSVGGDEVHRIAEAGAEGGEVVP